MSYVEIDDSKMAWNPFASSEAIKKGGEFVLLNIGPRGEDVGPMPYEPVTEVMVEMKRFVGVSRPVWRIENQHGEGMYRNNTAWSASKMFAQLYWSEQENAEINDRHPTPYCDPDLSRALASRGHFFNDLICGFDSIEQMREWLWKDSFMYELASHNFYVAVYQAREVYVGKTQVLFLRSDQFERYNIIKFFDL